MSEPYSPPPSSGQAPQSSTTAVISLIAGILGWTLFPILGSIVAVVTGHMAKKEIRESMGRMGGEGMATAGLILGYSSLVIMVLCICLFIGLFAFGVSIPIFESGGF